MMVVSFYIMVEMPDEDFTKKAMARLLEEFEDLVYKNNYELYDSEWLEDDC